MDTVRSLTRATLVVAAALALLLIAFAGGYGYHRDELYFLAAGHHLAWGYADQGPLTPLIARAMSEVAPDSLTVLRVPSAFAAAGTVLLTALLARELGGSRRAESIAALVAAVSSVVLFTGHLLSTSTFDLLCWTAVTWLVVRAVRRRDDRLWIPAGLVLGLGLLNKPLPAFLALGVLAGVVVAGPRRLLRSRHVWIGAGLALALWVPWLVWQARHGWPQVDVSRSIAAGGSASSEPWWAVVPFQVLLVSPLLAPVWIAGLVRLFRDPAVREVRFLGWTWVVLAVAFMATGGKPYYLAGLLPLLVAAGAGAVDTWLRRDVRGVRAPTFGAAVVVSAAVGAVIALPVLPASSADPVIALNGDVGETIGWRDLVRTVSDVRRDLPARPEPVILTANYGEAGAVDRYGPAFGLPRAVSGHNAFGYWAHPGGRRGPVIAVGLSAPDLAQLARCRTVARVDNSAAVDNDERRAPVAVCRGPERPWSRVWPALRRLG